jgi:predicted esterase
MIPGLNDPPPEDFRLLHFAQSPGAESPHCIIWLHGIGERGTDLTLVSKYGLPAALAEGRLTVNADVICPQLESGLAWAPRRLAHLVVQMTRRYEGTALVGFSLGALGVCELLARCGPQAAVHIAIAPSSSTLVVASQHNTRFLAISGEHDPWPEGGEFIATVRARGGEADAAVVQGAGHYISESALVQPAVVQLLASIGVKFTWASQ